MDCTKTTEQILESSERQYRICSLSSLGFWHIALIVILIILREKEFEFGNDIDKNEKKKMREISRIVNKLYLYVFVVFLFFNNFRFF